MSRSSESRGTRSDNAEFPRPLHLLTTPELFISYLAIRLCMASNPAPAATVHKTLAERLSPPGIVPPQPKCSRKRKRARKASYHSHHPPHVTLPGPNTPPTLLA